jgi:DNA-directed RNA polymerase subunit alpha
MSLALKDSPPGFDPRVAVDTYGTGSGDAFGSPFASGYTEPGDDDGRSFAETEQY